MKRFLFAVASAAIMPWSAGAQVEKQVEVTKAYVPSLERAAKIAIVPDMTDTACMRPEIDYTITPLSLQTELATRPIRPARVTYWEFNRPRPFYLKVGAGYPLNSVFDFYAATQNRSTGYVVGYVNHEGDYADIENDYGVKNASTRMRNRIGAAAGKYFDRHTLEGEIAYENRLYHRYGAWYGAARNAAGWAEAPSAPGQAMDYSDLAGVVRFGDDFKDLTRTNFEVALRGGLFFDHAEAFDGGERDDQLSVGVRARVARGFGRHRIAAGAGYDYRMGRGSVRDYDGRQLRVGLRYGLDGRAVRLEVGADYYYDEVDYRGKAGGGEGRSYVIPFARFDVDLGTPAFGLFAELDGGVYENSYRSLVRQNPYVADGAVTDRSSVDYNIRAGIDGSLGDDRMNYRLYGAFSVRDHHVYWVGQRAAFLDGDGGWETAVDYGLFLPLQGRQTVGSVNGEIEYRPVTTLALSLGVHGYFYNDEEQYDNGEPSFRGDFGIRYDGRKVAFGAGVGLQSRRSWSVLYRDLSGSGAVATGSAAAPFAADLRVDFDWKLSRGVTLFAEGRNLANRPLYAFIGYPECGIRFTVGAKLDF